MKRFSVVAAVSFALAACVGAGGPRGQLKPVANPSAVVAAELAFARLAQDKGQWAAFRATAADGAEMFVPHRVKAADWLKGRAEPAIAVKWQPHAVWSSCDGSYAVTRGNWESPNASGTFATIWQRQKNGEHKWVGDMSLTSEGPMPPPEMIAARVADCKTRPVAPIAEQPLNNGDYVPGASADGTLRWSTSVAPDGARSVTVSLWNGTAFEPVLRQLTQAAQR